MTAKDREIQRWTFGCSNSAAQAHMSTSRDAQGKFVLYADHLRAVKLAEIEVLEEASKLICYGCRNDEPTVEIMGAIYHLSGHLRARESCCSQAINERIAALRAQLGGVTDEGF